MSGLSNVKYWLREHGYDPNDKGLCKRIFKAAKQTDHTLTDGEIRAICRAGEHGKGHDTDTMESRSNSASGTVLRVLVVEDEPDSSALIADELIHKGFRVETVGSGPQGLAGFIPFEPSAIG